MWELISVESGSFAIQNIAGNIVLFVPLGIFLPILMPAFQSINKILAIGFFLSLSFELIQLITVLGFFDIDDTILNTLGALIGFWICRLFFPSKNANPASS
jgi:glycopeptide antibiotics resistance protein